MTTVDDLFEDIDVAFEALRLSGDDEIAQRRAGRAVLGGLFEVREHLLESRADYWADVRRDPRGEVTEGIMVIRGRMTHGSLDQIRPSIKLALTGPKFLTSEYTYTGFNLVWLELDELPDADRARVIAYDKRLRYADHVAGYLVLPTLDQSRRFLRDLAG
jgi:hypothetical protein